MAAVTASVNCGLGRASAGPGQSQEGPELERQVVLEIGHVDQTVDEHRDQGQEHPEVNRLPAGSRPFLPTLVRRYL